MGYFRFFFIDQTFFRPVPYPINKKNIFLTKNPLNYYSLKVTKFHRDSVKNESARTKKLQGGAKRHPPPRLFRVNEGIKMLTCHDCKNYFVFSNYIFSYFIKRFFLFYKKI